MVYLFERKDEVMRIEVRFSEPSQTYQLICWFPNGTSTQESFSGEASFRTRLDEIRAQLEGEQWETSGPDLLSDRWILSR